MTTIEKLLATPGMQLLTGILLSALWLLFAAAHVSTYGTSGKASLVMFAIAETVIAVLFLIRSPARTLSAKPMEWIVAIAATFLPLLLRPTAEAAPVAEWGLILGSALQIAGVLSLNRSLALVPALRTLKTTGMYRFIRHPIYFSYLITFSCYLAANFTPLNLAILLASFSLLVARIYFEERHLRQTAEYRSYQDRVRWRLIPFVF
ncbi:methyltransferase family protein [Aromatoleum sp.]|uniref:methyltransferase family protein n=1 Tax=Aromatoleum sp. TaxID=2307007 RepID=UPI002FCC080A